ncbi:cytochrome P450 3A21 [Trichonephila inaurata madagascariensis]|uniref:Cytochrome P450 3A21 n=1 Tax=Trichonephila inaurata madagascariensis TaxID=2747483 RepID=A0A8X6YZH5_9ARAC|nr:cytochrome P450 3A21 [Trichonephila inaurata madagascariensis]
MIGFEVFVGFISTTFVTAFTSFLLYWYSTRNFDFWKKRGVVYAKPIPFFGNTLELLWKPLNEIELERYFRLGRIYGHFEGNRPVLSVADPKVLREILVKEFPSISSRRVFYKEFRFLEKERSCICKTNSLLRKHIGTIVEGVHNLF